MSCAVEAAECREGLEGSSGPCRNAVGVFENRIEDRKPLRVPRDVLGRIVGFREIRPEHLSEGETPRSKSSGILNLRV